ncbi:hypothetical protein DRE_04101 [Drechslerella stenobrocha 248]|uniref:Cell division control protein 14 n=1 Tax=Drechslerella stenobrocha 248 TaxID=1043628 RepID=W7HTD5_9PEZI|nr:hypothetical protein DRE_04101 [Drechslerella stenobrocha 248]
MCTVISSTLHLPIEERLADAFDRISRSNFVEIRAGLISLEEYIRWVAGIPEPRHQDNREETADAGGEGTQQEYAIPSGPRVDEFKAMQDGFEYNIAIRVVACMDYLLGLKETNCYRQESLLMSCLEILEGALLLHPDSRNLFARQLPMGTLVDTIPKRRHPGIQERIIGVLAITILECPANTRTFEAQNGLVSIANLFKNRATSKEVKKNITELIYVYLLPEDENSQTAISSAQLVDPQFPGDEAFMASRCRTVEQKSEMLGAHLQGLDEIVRDIRHHPWMFGTKIVEKDDKEGDKKDN